MSWVKTKRTFLALCLLIVIFAGTGCNFNLSKVLSPKQTQEKELIRVELHFTDNERVTGYIRDLGMDENSRVYNGGSSVNYIYDKEGRVTGSFNYQRLIFIKILPEDNSSH